MKAKINDRFSYKLSEQSDLKVLHQDGTHYQFRRNGELIKIELLEYDVRSKKVELAINGFVFKVKLEDELDDVIQLIRQKSAKASGNQEVTAPIPGLIKSLSKETGDTVQQGESVLVLEAMKMENTIQAPVTADQIHFHVKIGDHVSKGQKLFTLFISCEG